MILLASLLSAFTCTSSNQQLWVPDPIVSNRSVFDINTLCRLSQASTELHDKFEKLKNQLELLIRNLDSLIPVTIREDGWFVDVGPLSNQAVNRGYKPTLRHFNFSTLRKPIAIVLDAVHINTGINPYMQRYTCMRFDHLSRVGGLKLWIYLGPEFLYTIDFQVSRTNKRTRNNINDNLDVEVLDCKQITLLMTPNDMSHPRRLGGQPLNSFEIRCDGVSIGKFWFRPGIFDGMEDETGNEAEDSEAENYRGYPSKGCDILVESFMAPLDKIPVDIRFRED